MFLSNLTLKNFRSYSFASVTFDSKVNLLQGENAQGKTNLLEALYLLSTGRSFRTRSLQELVKEGERSFSLEATFIRDEVTQTLHLHFDGMSRALLHNSTSYTSFIPLLGLLPHILYAPEDISLLMGAPQERRRFLDLLIAQTDPHYLHHLVRYMKAMKQRNHLLRMQQESTLSAWEQSMALSAVYLLEKRRKMCASLNLLLPFSMSKLSLGRDHLEILYEPELPASLTEAPASALAEHYKAQRPKEMVLGSTLNGPHRDELRFLINQQEAKLFSSEGQKRCALLALRLAAWQKLKNDLSTVPLFSIDDVGMHLDPMRQELLEEELSTLGQVFLSSPKTEVFRLPLKRFLIHQGKVEEKYKVESIK